MHRILIPENRAKLLASKDMLREAAGRLGCELRLEGNELTIQGDALGEYNARMVMQAFARGFDLNTSCLLLGDDCFFESVDMKGLLKRSERVKRIKARVIGREGKTKEYVQQVSGAHVSVYGDTVSFIGTLGQIRTARAAMDTLLEGGTHNKAYIMMQKERKRQDAR